MLMLHKYFTTIVLVSWNLVINVTYIFYYNSIGQLQYRRFSKMVYKCDWHPVLRLVILVSIHSAIAVTAESFILQMNRKFFCVFFKIRAVDPHSFYADPDPGPGPGPA